MTISITNVASTDTFQSWFNKTNQIADAISTSVVTTAANSIGGQNIANLFISGISSANTLAAVQALRGGTVDASSNLAITSNVHVEVASGTSNLSSNTTYLNLKSTTGSLIATTMTMSGGVVSITSNLNVQANSISVVQAGRVGINTTSAAAALDVVGTVNMGGGAVAISGPTTISANATITANASFTGPAVAVSGTLGVIGNATLSANLAVTNNIAGNSASFSNTMSVNGILTANSITANALALSVVLPLSSGGTGGNSAVNARTSLGLGTISTLNTITSSQFTTPVSLVIYDSTGTALKTLYGSTT